MSAWTGGSRGTKLGLPIAERVMLILVLEKPVYCFQLDEIRCALYRKLAHGSGSGEKAKGKVEEP
jgi:hypothetical protein